MNRSSLLFLSLVGLPVIVTALAGDCEDVALGDCQDPASLSLICGSPSVSSFCRRSCGLCGKSGDDVSTLLDDGFSAWTVWSSCTQSCGAGVQTRTRTCNGPDYDDGSSSCRGPRKETRKCTGTMCPADDGFSTWTVWSSCTQSCGEGVQTRTRTCNGPDYDDGSSSCRGPGKETRKCTDTMCPVAGGYSNWSTWSSCSQTCGTGVQIRTRSCENPAPKHGGLSCTGKAKDSKSCKVLDCPVDGSFSEWSNWTDCSVTCGTGTQVRQRYCNNPKPSNGGSPCVGDDTNSKICRLSSCPVNGGFSDWSEWSPCSSTCDEGVRSRDRSCTNPPLSNCGQGCTGNTTEAELCTLKRCPDDGCNNRCGYGFDCSCHRFFMLTNCRCEKSKTYGGTCADVQGRSMCQWKKRLGLCSHPCGIRECAKTCSRC